MSNLKSTILHIFIAFAFFSNVAADLCTDKEEEPGKSCGIHVHSGVPPAQKQELLRAHNAPRRGDLPLLTWDDDLAQAAQSWADECKDTVDECRSTGVYKTFEQLVSKTENDVPFDLTAIVNKWAEDPNSPAYPLADGALSVLDRVGCGIKVSKVNRHGGIAAAIKFTIKTYYVVCNYASSMQLSH